MGKRTGRQKGPQQHAEGQHGERTHARFIEQLHQRKEEQQDDLAVQAGADEPGAERLEGMRSRGDFYETSIFSPPLGTTVKLPWVRCQRWCNPARTCLYYRSPRS